MDPSTRLYLIVCMLGIPLASSARSAAMATLRLITCFANSVCFFYEIGGKIRCEKGREICIHYIYREPNQIVMDVTQALKDAENSLRDFIGAILPKMKGENWIYSCGVTTSRINQWKSRQEEDMRKSKLSGIYEERLIYYADFYDLFPILSTNWNGPFSEAFGKVKTMEVWLDELGKLRDPDAHRRELLPHQKYLALGIAGEIRTKITRYRSKMEGSEDVFPRLDVVRDSLGNSVGISEEHAWTSSVLRVGDKIDFVITASDPLGEEMEYRMERSQPTYYSDWQKGNTFTWDIDHAHIGKNVAVGFQVRSLRSYHAKFGYDHAAYFHYDVLPKK
jgi:hypothetical protein